MKTLVTVLTADPRAFKQERGGFFKRVTCQCIVHKVQEDGSIRQEVGVLNVPEALCPIRAADATEHSLPDVPPGDYLAEYGLAIKFDSKELVGQLKALTRQDQPKGKSVIDRLPEAEPKKQ